MTERMKRVIYIFITFLLVIASCYYDNKEYLYPEMPGSCDTSKVSLSLTIKPILQSYCYTCHSNTTYQIGNNIKLENYADIKIAVDNGTFYGSVTHLQGFSPMPKGGGKLSNCNLNQIRAWINQGARNN